MGIVSLQQAPKIASEQLAQQMREVFEKQVAETRRGNKKEDAVLPDPYRYFEP